MVNSYCILAHKVSNCLIFTVNFLKKFQNNKIFIHVDLKSDLDEFNFLRCDNVFLIEERFDIKWGHISMVKATLALLNKVDGDGYCTLLSGDDFPCVDNNEIYAFFSKLNGRNLLHIQDKRNSFVDPYARYNYIYPKCFFKKDKDFLDKAICFFYNKFPFRRNTKGRLYLKNNRVELFKGTQWFSFDKESLDCMLNYLHCHPEYLNSFEGTYCPDEIFFQTLVILIKLPLYHDDREVNDCLRYVDWNTGPDFPKILNKEDLKKIKKTKCLFARKGSNDLSAKDFYKLLGYTDAL
ncbi:beta-1,6-N-acetylglucosaminyltransferase [Rosenbergiella epipactidis]|uniref:beta-1,6-N-acetylglucosaminyltransferase n=1 Tax=Rosenbergiella epipactidis TaxID=1544694 RepID=UPI001F4EAC74|nr:beta-1,6-N-acetylglucosaminyltransferase [Rosenbergiella epipactidis]